MCRFVVLFLSLSLCFADDSVWSWHFVGQENLVCISSGLKSRVGMLVAMSFKFFAGNNNNLTVEMETHYGDANATTGQEKDSFFFTAIPSEGDPSVVEGNFKMATSGAVGFVSFNSPQNKWSLTATGKALSGAPYTETSEVTSKKTTSFVSFPDPTTGQWISATTEMLRVSHEAFDVAVKFLGKSSSKKTRERFALSWGL